MALALPIPQAGELLLVLQPDNLERMKAGDPFTIHLDDYGFPLKVRVTVCFEESTDVLAALQKRGDTKGLIDYLHRGWEHRQGEDVIPAESARFPR